MVGLPRLSTEHASLFFSSSTRVYLGQEDFLSPSSIPSTMPTNISIAVFRGDETDGYRHTAIYVRYEDGEIDLLHITGAHPRFQYTAEHTDPSTCNLPLEGLVDVGVACETIPAFMVRIACSQTPVHNEYLNTGWNSQSWVSEALASLVAIGCVTNEQRSRALEGMNSLCLSGRDEQVPCVLPSMTDSLV